MHQNGEKVTDVIILGAGIIGCSIAFYLRQMNVDVVVLERGEVGGQASSAAAGLLAPLGPLSGPGPFADLLLSSFALFPALVSQLEDATGIKLGYERAGALRVVRNPKRVARLRKRLEAWQPLGLPMQWLSGSEARQLEPCLASDISAAIYVPAESYINAAHLVQAFAQAAKNSGARLYSHRPVQAIQHAAGRITGIQTVDGERIACRYVVIAAGAWSAQFECDLNLSLPIVPQRGQMLAYSQSSSRLRHIVFGEAVYLVPGGEAFLVGATKEDVGFDVEVSEEGQNWLSSSACKLVPTLMAAGICERRWAGLRPATPDARPVLGPVPQWSNLYLASGHNSVGIILSPLTGQKIAECIVTGRVPALLESFSLRRFT